MRSSLPAGLGCCHRCMRRPCRQLPDLHANVLGLRSQPRLLLTQCLYRTISTSLLCKWTVGGSDGRVALWYNAVTDFWDLGISDRSLRIRVCKKCLLPKTVDKQRVMGAAPSGLRSSSALHETPIGNLVYVSALVSSSFKTDIVPHQSTERTWSRLIPHPSVG